jgi:putative membrane-bound dehydrogenase-like protein
MPSYGSSASVSVRLAAFLVVGLTAAWMLVPHAEAQVSPHAQPIDITPDEVQAKANLVSVPDGFTFHLFAAPPEVNYPTAITAAPDGALFVAVDKNGSLDQERGRGQILKVTDADDDGQADHYTVFVDSVDSPRGLVYDGRTLYVMHPPTLTAYEDADGDGVSDRARDLVTGLGFDLDFRGADHTTNGMQMGIDGWLYIAVGDYGFVDAEGTDGRRIHHRGGGIVRVRPDGSELEIVATGLRNVYDVTLDPFLNGFERGNTNDGYGWRIRLQHIVPQAHYGYPSLFWYFSDEVMPPLADYGGGSGAGALYVDAPHLPDSLGNALYTVDWGRSAVFHHTLTPTGASFEPTQQSFFQVPVPTDMTIDGRSNLYVSSWMGASFRYAGEDVGFIARLTHEDATPEAVPDFQAASTDALLDLLTAPHSLHRLHAQRELLRRAPGSPVAQDLARLTRDGDQPLDVRVAALFTLKQLEGAASHQVIASLLEDPALREFALRALADRTTQLEGVPAEPFVEALADADPRVRLHALNGLARLGATDAADAMMPLTADSDRTVAHVAVQSLAALEATAPALAAARTGSPGLAQGAHHVLQRLHTPETVDGLIALWETAIDPYVQRQALESLARLYHREAAWNGDDWWGTTPSPRGPYYEPVTWSESDRIRPLLQEALTASDGIEYRRRVHRIELQRAVPNASSATLLAASSQPDSVKAQAVRTLVGHASVPAEALAGLDTLARSSPALQQTVTELLVAQSALPPASIDLLRRSVLDGALASTLRAQALETLLRTAGDERPTDGTAVVAELLGAPSVPAPLAAVIQDYASDDDHAAHIGHITELARATAAPEQKLGYAVLLHLARNEDLDEAPRTTAQTAVAEGWSANDHAAALLWAIGFTQHEDYADAVRQHLDADADAVAAAARYAAERLGL